MKTLALLLAIVAGLAMLPLKHPPEESALLTRDTRLDRGPALCVSYPHALVKCGLASSDDFEAHRNDRDLHEHYSEVGLVQPALLTADEWDFASFRGAGGIVWTSKRILIRAGEHVFRDRSGNTIRARCGNRLSQQPRTPVAAQMPPEMEPETPQIEFVEASPPVIWADKAVDVLMPPMPSLPSLAPAPETFIVPPQGPLPWELLRPVIRSATIVPPPVHVSQTPEPSTFFLLLGPMAILFYLWRRT